MASNIIRRIFANRPLPPQDASQEEFTKQFEAAITDFENSGFLEQTKCTPVVNDMDLVEKLHDHRDDIVILKYWKRGCVPCLISHELVAEVKKLFAVKNPRVHFFAVNSKDPQSLGLVAHQLIEGTPTIQAFHGGKQVGEEIMAMSVASFNEKLDALVDKHLK